MTVSAPIAARPTSTPDRQRGLYAQRIHRRVALVDVPIDHDGRVLLIERHVESLAELQGIVAAGRAALDALDARAAARTLRLENQLAEHRRLADQDTARARQLAGRAQTLGWRQRSKRQGLLDTAAALRDQADRHHTDFERIELELARLSATGRNPDQWLERHAHTVADGLAARPTTSSASRPRSTAKPRLPRSTRPPTCASYSASAPPPTPSSPRPGSGSRSRSSATACTTASTSPATGRWAQTPRSPRCAPPSPTATTATGSPATSPAHATSGAWTPTHRSRRPGDAGLPAADPDPRR